MNMHKALYLRKDINKVYVKKRRKKRLASNLDCVDVSTQEFEDNVDKSKESLGTTVSNRIGKISLNRNTIKTSKQKWEEKQL